MSLNPTMCVRCETDRAWSVDGVVEWSVEGVVEWSRVGGVGRWSE